MFQNLYKVFFLKNMMTIFLSQATIGYVLREKFTFLSFKEYSGLILK